MNARTDKMEAQELSPKLQRFAKFQMAIAIIAIVITLATTITIYPLIQKRAQLKTEISQLQSQRVQEIQQKNEEIEQLQKRIKETRGLAVSLTSIKGKRKKTVNLALDLKDRNIPFKMGGRKPEDGGFDLSGFIDYVLSQIQSGIIKDPINCNQSCLMNRSGVVKATTLSELKPGDLIFYEGEYTMMYLGGEKCIGMIYQGAIEVKDIHFMKIIGYGKVPYSEDFIGKFGIPLETDEKLQWAKTNVHEKGEANGFDEVYIFKDGEGYRTVAVFDSWEKANENLPLAMKINKTANEIKDFSGWCFKPKWIEDGGYFDCLK